MEEYNESEGFRQMIIDLMDDIQPISKNTYLYSKILQKLQNLLWNTLSAEGWVEVHELCRVTSATSPA